MSGSNNTPIGNTQFRSDFPEFADPTKYPDSQLTMYLQLAANSLDLNRWGQYYTIGQELWAAHFLALEYKNALQSAAGGQPGDQVGPISSKSVGGASVSFDVGSATLQNGGFWNMTSYGTRYLWFARMAGMGGTVAGGCGPVGPAFGPAWPGPWPGW